MPFKRVCADILVLVTQSLPSASTYIQRPMANSPGDIGSTLFVCIVEEGDPKCDCCEIVCNGSNRIIRISNNNEKFDNKYM